MLKSKSMCEGCRDDFYNDKNPYGVKECWSFPEAEVVKRKFVPMSQRPPWNQRAETTLSCYQRPGSIKVAPDRTC